MSTSKRRLSKGGKAANLPLQEEELTIDEDLNVQSNSRRNSFARRRHSIGKSSTVEESEESIQDQNRIADMYKSIIKMSSENKINAKNSWNLDLINHMDKMIKNDENSQRNGSKGVNFQKASCTLDASIKIYSHRVDDTWSSSYRILENLSRSELVEEDDLDDDDDDDDEGPKEKKASRVGSKSTSKKLNLIKTIEKKMENLDFAVQENSHAADPMFHKMSQAFDEGGAKGMLMSNLRVSPQSSTIMFSALNQDKEESEVEEKADNNESTTEAQDDVDTSTDASTVTPDSMDATKDTKKLLAASKALLARSGLQIDNLLAKSVCSSLNTYRDALDIFSNDQLRYLDFAPIHRIQSLSGENMTDDVVEDDYHDGAGGPDTLDDFDDNDDDHEESEFFGESTVPLTADALASLGQSTTRRTSRSSDDMSIYSSTSKIQWDSVYEGDDNNSVCSSQMGGNDGSSVLSVGDTNPIGFQTSKQNAASTVAFLAMHTGATNQWAGAKHWRRSTRQKTVNKASEDTDATTTEKKVTKSKPKKEKFLFDFTKVGEGVSEQINSKFEKIKGSKKLDPTVLSDAVVKKGILQGEEGIFTLPADARLNTKDLCRLFHWSSMIVPPTNTIEDITKAICTPSTLSHRYVGVSGDQLLRTQNGKRRLSGGSAVDTIWVAPTSTQSCEDVDSFDNSPDDYFDDDDDDDHFQSEYMDENSAPNSINVQKSKGHGLNIEVEGGLLEAPRKVNKLNIGYAQSSKRVNVKKLKSDLWSKLETDCSSEVNENVSSSSSNDKELSFQDVVCDIAQEQTQKDASMSFYFICLLHLANEKNLCIKDSATMDDLKISKGFTY